MIGASSRLVAHSLTFAHVMQMYVSKITSNPFWDLSKIKMKRCMRMFCESFTRDHLKRFLLADSKKRSSSVLGCIAARIALLTGVSSGFCVIILIASKKEVGSLNSSMGSGCLFGSVASN